MDKSFNDEELSDIMKEIEALEQDFKQDEVKTATPVLEEFVGMDEKIVVPESTAKVVAIESQKCPPKAENKSSTTMSFKVQGNLTLELLFDVGGKKVALEVTETGLNIEMDGGMKFTVPVSTSSSLKKAV